MDKFGRNYTLEVETLNGSTLTISLPFTIEFDITRKILASANVCQIRVYNLSLVNRNQIRFNVYDGSVFRSVRLRAGYGQNLATIFYGNISAAWSVREGVNFITQIECYDGGFDFINGATNIQFPAGAAQKDVIKTIMGTLPHVDIGAVGEYPGNLSRGNSYSGNTMDILNELTGGGAFIDNRKVNALGTDEYIASLPTLAINSQSGLLGTPILEQQIVRFDMIFEPGLNAGQKISLTSITESNFNGEYKVTSLKHRGMISEAVCGSVITTGEFFLPKKLTGIF